MLLEGGGDAAQQLASALARLMDLDDLCLLQILQHLTPLPDLFHVALCNKRLRGLASGRRLFLVVHPDGPVSPEESQRLLHSPDQGSGGVASPAPRRFSSIEAAVQASRPGNTILLEPGTHTVTHTIRVPWPLHFVSDSTVADDTLLVAAHGLDTVFDFRASGKLTNMTIKSVHSPCVIHRKSSLLLEGCLLMCSPDRGMEHLSSPLVTLASGASTSPAWTCGSHGVGSVYQLRAAASTGSPAPGILSVKETRILGSGQAVKCEGSGSLQGVRVIYQVRDPMFWFEVDSSIPGFIQTSGRNSSFQKPKQHTERRDCGWADMPCHHMHLTEARQPETPDMPLSKRRKNSSPL
mmetsp:Transcript_21499/g.59752  ORF Transcript_21499/g.59752 Transcript_21499/m.59752 type:complete len:351 (-) Transcript_21499:171-1223(-)